MKLFEDIIYSEPNLKHVSYLLLSLVHNFKIYLRDFSIRIQVKD